MKSFAVALLALASAVTAESAAVTPVQKVTQMLQDMLARSQEEKNAEEVAHTTYVQWCDDTSAHKSAAIEKGKNTIEALEASIEEGAANIESLTRDIATLDSEMARWTQDTKAAREVRDMESTDYQATNTDYSESIDALGRAIAVLKKQSYDRAQASDLLLQVSAMGRIPASAKKVITSFISQSSESGAASFLAAPEANAYEFQSGGIVDMLTGLEDKFQDERNTLQKEEASNKHNFEMMVQDLRDQINRADKQKAMKNSDKGLAEEKKASDEGDLSDTQNTLAEDEKYFKDLTAQCAQKASDFAQRQELRAGEIDALTQAIEIISSGAVAGSADKHLPAMAQVKTSFVQISEHSPLQKRVAAFLALRAEKTGSRVLSMLASKASQDPFKEVKKMIKTLVVRLMEEANEEAEHKGWCDTELSVNQVTRESKTSSVEKLTAEVESLTALSAKLAQEVADLQTAVAESDAAVAEAKEQRSAESAKNAATVKDAIEAQEAVTNALTILREFYAKAADATALVQQSPADDAPASFTEPFKGDQDRSTGVIGMLEVIQSDFARLESETKASESQANKEYTEFINDSEVDTAVKNTEIGHKTDKRTATESDLAMAKKDLKGTHEELDAAVDYYEKLKPTCVSTGVSYEERVARRKDEIESLQEALKILKGDEFAF